MTDESEKHTAVSPERTMGPVSRYSRADKLLGGLDVSNTSGLEIGALSSPLLRPPQANIRFVDHADTETLRSKYAGDPNVPLDQIVPVDAVWGDKTLAECFPCELFDYVIASHVIEHVPNVIGWLMEIADVLRPGGRLILAIPDRRYSFDVLRRTTSLSELIDNHLRGARRPTPGQVFDYNANAVAFDHVMAWMQSSRDAKPQYYLTPQAALAKAHESRAGAYLDGHCSVFTARSLLELLNGLLELDLLPFSIERFHVAVVGSNEMTLILTREATPFNSHDVRAALGNLLRQGVDSEGLSIDADLEETATHATRKDRQIKDLQQAIAAMETSTCWKLTTPIRQIGRMLGASRLRQQQN